MKKMIIPTAPYREVELKRPEPIKINLIQRIRNKIPSSRKRIEKLCQLLPIALFSIVIGGLWSILFCKSFEEFQKSNNIMRFLMIGGEYLLAITVFALLFEGLIFSICLLFSDNKDSI